MEEGVEVEERMAVFPLQEMPHIRKVLPLQEMPYKEGVTTPGDAI